VVISKKIPLFLALIIALGHSFVPHSHDEPADISIHHHDDHHGVLDMVACFFTVDHESEDLENYLTERGDALPSNHYAVIPAKYSERPSPFLTESHIDSPYRDGPTLRGPPQS
jgi:hypothetical protein